MAEFRHLRPCPATGTIKLADVVKVADSLKRGSLAVLPTETGYMLAALATSIPAIERVFTAKGRAAAHVMHVACSSLKMAETIGELNEPALRLLGELTPGPVTVVVNKTPLLPDTLVSVNGTVGIRVPDHPATLQVITEVGAPLTATSLNVSGAGSASIGKLEMQFMQWPGNEVVYVVEDDDRIIFDAPSTLVRLSGEDIEILREGPISQSEVRRVASLTGNLEAADRT
jgi:L-threonylcarbamoyladenylate synthase